MDITTRMLHSFAEESKTQRGGRRDWVQEPKFPSAACRPQRALATPCAPPAVAEYLQQFSTVLVTVRIHIGGYGQQSKWEPYKSKGSKDSQSSTRSPGTGATAGLVGSGGELARLLEAAGEAPVVSLRLFLPTRRKALGGGGGTEPELPKV